VREKRGKHATTYGTASQVEEKLENPQDHRKGVVVFTRFSLSVPLHLPFSQLPPPIRHVIPESFFAFRRRNKRRISSSNNNNRRRGEKSEQTFAKNNTYTGPKTHVDM